jgi:type 1 glutamine amidotransferase
LFKATDKNMKSNAKRLMRVKPVLLILCGLFTLALFLSASVSGQAKRPLRILLVTGGCCHNYGFQTEAIKASLPASLPAVWTVVNEGGTGTTAMIPLYDKVDWAKGYDLVIHNECFADTKDPEYLRRIAAEHYKGVNAVVIHCAMHSYRAAEVDDWREFLGVTSRRHDHQSQYPVKAVARKHKVMRGVPAEWTGPKDELYVIEKVWPKTTVLAVSTSELDGKIHPVVWTNRYGKARVFGTTFGHSDEMFKDPVFIKLLGNGIRWATEN